MAPPSAWPKFISESLLFHTFDISLIWISFLVPIPLPWSSERLETGSFYMEPSCGNVSQYPSRVFIQTNFVPINAWPVCLFKGFLRFSLRLFFYTIGSAYKFYNNIIHNHFPKGSSFIGALTSFYLLLIHSTPLFHPA